MVQSWYQGGLSVFDWTDIDHPKEIAFFDRGPVDATRMAMGGSWSAYWYNGVIISSEIARGMDIYELVASGLITENELAAAKTVRMPYWNTQDQMKYSWAAEASSSRARTSIRSSVEGPGARRHRLHADDAGQRGEAIRQRTPHGVDDARDAAENSGCGIRAIRGKCRCSASTVTDLAGR